MPFSPTAKTATNIGFTITCVSCRKPRLLHSQTKVTDAEKRSLKRVLFNGYQYICGSSLQDIMLDTRNRDVVVIGKVFCRKNLSCSVSIEIPYYSKLFQSICIYCATSKGLLPLNDVEYPRCRACSDKPSIKRNKRKKITEADLRGKKQNK